MSKQFIKGTNMKQQELFPDDPSLAALQKREELEDEFYDWLQSHFDLADIEYFNMLIDVIDTDTFFSIAEQWAINNYKNKAYY